MKTLESIFSEIKENGVITKQQLQLLKNRSNKQQQDVIDYGWEKLYYNYDYTQRKRMVKRFARELHKAINDK